MKPRSSSVQAMEEAAVLGMATSSSGLILERMTTLGLTVTEQELADAADLLFALASRAEIPGERDYILERYRMAVDLGQRAYDILRRRRVEASLS